MLVPLFMLAKTVRNTDNNASFPSITATTKSLGFSENGLQYSLKNVYLRAEQFLSIF